jgi:hypothetical protein
MELVAFDLKMVMFILVTFNMELAVDMAVYRMVKLWHISINSKILLNNSLTNIYNI